MGDTTSASQTWKGRSAGSNQSGRFEAVAREAFVSDGEFAQAPETILRAERARSILTKNNSPDIGFDRSINPYRGCEHGCIYCYARPSHEYIGLSAGLDFETRIFHKENAAQLLDRELRRQRYRPQVVALGANTDPYQPAERRLGLTRSIIETMLEFRHPLAIISKSAMITRDVDLLRRMAELRLVTVAISITSLRGDVSGTMEPRASAPHRRLEAMHVLADNGVPVQVMVAPVIPALTDPELEAILEASAAAGAERAGYILLRLPHSVKMLFREWLEAHFPLQAERVLHQLREMRGGREYDSRFGQRMTGTGIFADLMRSRFALAARRLGLNRRQFPLRLDLFRPPAAAGQRELPFPA